MEGNPNRAEAERLLGIADKLLQSRDLNSSREFAILSQEADPLLDGSEQILAVVDVLLAGERNLVNNHPDWYAVLGVDPRQSSGDQDLIKRQYHRLALLLHPDKNRYALADQAFQLVSDAWNVLSISSKKSQFDGELNLFFTKVDLNDREQQKLPARRSGGKSQRTPAPTAKAPVSAGPRAFSAASSFWTACPYCYGLYEYPKMYEECCVRCQNCKRAFHAARISQLPPLVPGRDEYYCCWGFFPMGFNNEKEETDGGDETDAPAVNSTFPSWMPPVFPATPQTAAANGNSVPVGGGDSGTGRGSTVKRDATATKLPERVSSPDGVPKKRGRPRKNPLL